MKSSGAPPGPPYSFIFSGYLFLFSISLSIARAAPAGRCTRNVMCCIYVDLAGASGGRLFFAVGSAGWLGLARVLYIYLLRILYSLLIVLSCVLKVY